ncbi:MAG TPA: serine/threonine-protein kinase, partial [Ktedonobacteraceae bacterium]|nr:serine/threonine-protein kinase [Ktedonobacteraceae bacterium]
MPNESPGTITMLELQEPISGRYRLQQRLCRGGMSDVYLAYDELMQREVAIKLVNIDNTEHTQRLNREVQVMSKLSHDHILPTLDYGIYGAYHYLVMPYMRRGNLREYIAKSRLTQEEAGDILAQVASALQFAHDHGILHRDIKPSNILLDNSDEQHVYLADFGLATVMGEGSDITQTGCLIGTPEYMAPELIDRPESVSSDIYALGVLLYQMLTGQTPFTASTPVAVYWKQLGEEPQPPSYINQAISRPVEQVILRALHKDPQQRFPSARAMAQAYTAALQSTTHSEITPAAQTAAPTLVSLHKLNDSTLPDGVWQVVPWWQKPPNKIQKGVVSLVAIMLLATPFTLGLLLARGSTEASLVLTASTQFAGTTLPARHAVRHTPQSTSTVHGLSGFRGAQPAAPHTHQ